MNEMAIQKYVISHRTSRYFRNYWIEIFNEDSNSKKYQKFIFEKKTNRFPLKLGMPGTFKMINWTVAMWQF